MVAHLVRNLKARYRSQLSLGLINFTQIKVNHLQGVRLRNRESAQVHVAGSVKQNAMAAVS